MSRDFLNLCVTNLQGQLRLGIIEDEWCHLPDIRDRAAICGLRGDVPGHETCVAPESRPSVSNATDRQAGTTIAAVTASIPAFLDHLSGLIANDD